MAQNKKAAEQKEELLEEGTSVDVQKKESSKTEDDGRVDYILPKNVLGDGEVVDCCLNGAIFRVKCGETVRITPAQKEVLNNAIAQRAKVEALRKKKQKIEKLNRE